MNNKYLTFGNVFGDTFTGLKNNFIKLYLSVLVLLIPTALFGLIAYLTIGLDTIISFINNLGNNPDPSIFYKISGISMIVGLPIGIIYYVFNYRVIYNSYIGIQESILQTITFGAKNILKFIGLYFVFLIILVIAAIPMFAISFIDNPISVIVMIADYVFIFWIAIALSFSFINIAVEKITIIESLKDSWNLTKKRRGKIFFIVFVTIIAFEVVFVIIISLLSGSFTGVSALQSGNSAPSALGTFMPVIIMLIVFAIYPISFTFSTAIFINLKKEKGTLPGSDLADDFMEENEEETPQW